MSEPLPLATLHESVFRFLRGRDDAVLFGAYAVNAWVDEPRMTQDIDILSTAAERLAQEIQEMLAGQFHIAVRVRDIGPDKGLRLCQVRRPRNRHLVDVRRVAALPPRENIEGVWVVAPPELIAQKVMALHSRRKTPKAGTDWRDVAMLLIAFPALKTRDGEVKERLLNNGAGPPVLQTWAELVEEEIVAEADDDLEDPEAIDES